MLLKERKSTMADNHIHCECGGIAKFKIGTVQQKIGSRIILIHNVPHYSCSLCGSIGYDSNIKLTTLLKYAISNKLSDIDYNYYKKYTN